MLYDGFIIRQDIEQFEAISPFTHEMSLYTFRFISAHTGKPNSIGAGQYPKLMLLPLFTRRRFLRMKSVESKQYTHIILYCTVMQILHQCGPLKRDDDRFIAYYTSHVLAW